MKKLLGVVLGLAFCVSVLAGCHSSESPAAEVSSLPPVETNTPEEKIKVRAEIPKEEIRIGLIYTADAAEGSGYSYTHDLGVRKMQEILGISDRQIIRKNNVDANNPEAVRTAAAECVERGCVIVFAAAPEYKESISRIAKDYPEVFFAVAGIYEERNENVSFYTGGIYEARYLSGIAAGLRTETNKIGYVAAYGKKDREVASGLNAFARGVYAVNKNARIYLKTTSYWYAPKEERAAAQELIEDGCDVIAQHSDTLEPQLAAEEAGVWGIGYNYDMGTQISETILASVIWDWSVYYTQVVQGLIDGTWDGSSYFGDMRDGLVKLSGLSEFNAPETAARIEEAQALMLDGRLSVFKGVQETNEGTFVGEKGKAFSIGEIIGEMDWYFKNIQE